MITVQTLRPYLSDILFKIILMPANCFFYKASILSHICHPNSLFSRIRLYVILSFRSLSSQKKNCEKGIGRGEMTRVLSVVPRFPWSRAVEYFWGGMPNLSFCLTFRGPCIVSIFQYISNKMQRYTVYLYLETALHVSGGISTHHQERIQWYLQHLVLVKPLTHHLCKMWIFYEPKRVTLRNTRHSVEE